MLNPNRDNIIPFLASLEFGLIYIPAVLGTSFLNFRIIKNLLDSRKMTQQGNEAARRMTKAFSALCFSWVFTSVPYKVITLMRQLPLGLQYDGVNYWGPDLVAESKVLYLEMVDMFFYSIHVAYSFINSMILIALISNFRKPLERLAKALRAKLACCKGSESKKIRKNECCWIETFLLSPWWNSKS